MECDPGPKQLIDLHRRIAAFFRPYVGETAPPAPVDPFDKLIARLKGDLAAIEVFLATGRGLPRDRGAELANYVRGPEAKTFRPPPFA